MLPILKSQEMCAWAAEFELNEVGVLYLGEGVGRLTVGEEWVTFERYANGYEITLGRRPNRWFVNSDLRGWVHAVAYLLTN